MRRENRKSEIGNLKWEMSALSILKAFSLVEVTMALGITAFCLLSIFGLLSVGMISNKSAIEQTTATGIASGILADLRATPNAATSSPQYAITFPAAAQTFYMSEDGTKQATAATARYLVTITITASPMALVNIRITWPAAVPASSASGAFEVSTAIDRK